MQGITVQGITVQGITVQGITVPIITAAVRHLDTSINPSPQSARRSPTVLDGPFPHGAHRRTRPGRYGNATMPTT